MTGEPDSEPQLKGLGDVHPQLLRHACGFKLVNDGVDTRTLAADLGQIDNTARYTKMGCAEKQTFGISLRPRKFLASAQFRRRSDLDRATLVTRELCGITVLDDPSKQGGLPEPWPRPAVLPRSLLLMWQATRA
jgi:hypothetical protein